MSSALEELFLGLLAQWRCAGLLDLDQPVREYRFAPPRRWRFDFAWPFRHFAVEIEGGAFTGGRHGRGAGFEADLQKYNAAVIAGWRVLRFSGNDLKRRSAYVRGVMVAMLEARSGCRV